MLSFFISFIAVTTGLLSFNAIESVSFILCMICLGAALRPALMMHALLGGVLAVLHTGMAQHALASSRLLPENWQKPQAIIIDIDSVLYDKPYAQSILANVVSQHSVPFPQRVKLTRYSHEERFSPGERCELSVKLKPIHGYSNPGGRDFQLTWLARGVTAQGYVIEKSPIRCYPMHAWKTALFHYRADVHRLIQSRISDPAIQQLISALAIGEKQLDENTQIILQKTGTSHLLAISGLHVGLVGLIVYALTRPLAKLGVILKWHHSSRAIGLMISLIGIVFYIFVTGCAVSSQRAGWMCVIAVMIFLRQHPPMKIHLLMFVMFLMIVLNAFVVMDIGFWLSCCMVFILMMLCSYVIGAQKGVMKSLRLQLHLSLVALPLTLLLLKQGSLISPLANMVAIPVVSFGVVPLLLLFDCLVPLSGTLAGMVLDLASFVMEQLWWILSRAQEWPVLWETSVSTTRGKCCLLLACLLFMLPRGLWARLLGVYFILLVMLEPSPSPGKGEVWMTWLDVGQGLSTVIQTQHHTLVYDTGPRYDDLEVATLTLIPFLKSQGIHQIDQLMISHADNDHRGGIPRILRLFDVKSLIVGQFLSDIDEPQEFCHQNKVWDWDGVHFEQWNVQGKWITANNHSCVVKISTGAQSVLLLGDLEREAEWSLMRDHHDLTSTIISVPHHGSNTSSTIDFIKAVQPNLAIISSGFLNSYHHPHPKVMQRYASLGVKSLDTGQVGAIRVTLSGRNDIGIRCHRDKKC